MLQFCLTIMNKNSLLSCLSPFYVFFLSLCCYLFSSLVAYYCFAFTNATEGHQRQFGGPKKLSLFFCNCLQLNWSRQLLHLPYNLHANKQGCHSHTHNFCSCSSPVFCSQRLLRPSVLFIKLKSKLDFCLSPPST